MTVSLADNGVIALVGACDAADAEILQRHLLARRDATVDWRGCDSLHAAVFQVLLAAAVTPIGPPRGRFLIEVLERTLQRR